MKEEIKALLEKKKWKGKDLMIAIVIIGVLIAVLFIPTGERKGNSLMDIQTPVSENVSIDTSVEYEEELELRLEEILSQMEGVGEVEVMITLKSSTRTQDNSFTYTTQNTPGHASPLPARPPWHTSRHPGQPKREVLSH